MGCEVATARGRTCQHDGPLGFGEAGATLALGTAAFSEGQWRRCRQPLASTMGHSASVFVPPLRKTGGTTPDRSEKPGLLPGTCSP
jgi:hypothetical protein